MLDFAILILSLILVTKSASLAIRYSSEVAKNLNISKHLVGFLIVALVSILPETFIAINSAIQNTPSFGLGTLFGSNVADLTIVMAVIIFCAGRKLKIGSKILKTHLLYVLVIAIPLIFGLDGYYSREEGMFFIITGIIFYYWLIKSNRKIYTQITTTFSIKNFLYLLLSIILLLISSYFVVKHGIALAYNLEVSPVLVGLLGVSLGTTLPELFFSIKAVKNHHDDLALGDILGTVLSDAVIVVGIIALIQPFLFPVKIIYITGAVMLAMTVVLFYFMKTDKSITKKEAYLLTLLYLAFVLTEFFANK